MGSSVKLEANYGKLNTGSNPSRDRRKSFKQVVTALLTNARQKVWVSRVLSDDNYKWMSRFTEPSLLNGHKCQA